MDSVLEKVYAIKKEEIPQYAKHLMLGGGTRGGPVLKRGKGCWVEDIDGKRYIDCTSQSWALYLGYANDEINKIVWEHSQNLTHVHQGFDTLPRFALAKKLAQIAPEKLNRVSFTVGGGPAVEAGMKIAIKNREGAQEFICLYDSYHGVTLGTMGASWVSTMTSGRFIGGARFNRVTRQFIRVPNPYCYRCPLELDLRSCELMCLKLLRITIEKGINGPTAAVILEPVQASGGQVAALKLIDLLEKGVLQNCRDMGDYLGSELNKLRGEFPQMGDVRQAGLHIGIEFVHDPVTKEPYGELLAEVRKVGFKNGIIFGVGGAAKNVLKIKPPLNITREETDEVLLRFRKSMIDAIEAEGRNRK